MVLLTNIDSTDPEKQALIIGDAPGVTLNSVFPLTVDGNFYIRVAGGGDTVGEIWYDVNIKVAGGIVERNEATLTDSLVTPLPEE